MRKGVDFVEKYGGDIVFGSGPHVWKPVRVVRKENGTGKGVIFESLGNFLHPSLGAQSKNFIGRALFDVETLKDAPFHTVFGRLRERRPVTTACAESLTYNQRRRWARGPVVASAGRS